MNRVKATLAGFAFLAVIVLLCAAATVAERSMAANAAVKEAEATTPAYGEQGLPYGQALPSEILDQDEEYLYFSDRVLQRFHYDREAVEMCIRDSYVPEVLVAARAMYGALDILKPILAKKDVKSEMCIRDSAIADLLFMTVSHIAAEGLITLKSRKELTAQQAQIAQRIFDRKENEDRLRALEPQGEALFYPLQKEYELVGKVRMGDRTGAKAILNDLLGDIFFNNAGDMELLKARVVELVVVVSRAAVESGASLDKMLALNNQVVTPVAYTHLRWRLPFSSHILRPFDWQPGAPHG